MNSVWLYQTTEKAIVRKEKHLEEEEADEDEEVIYKIEVPANRYHYDDRYLICLVPRNMWFEAD